jgi:hypothetical protein
MAKQKVGVEEFLAELVHPRKAEILEVRNAILGTNPAITEQVKWNAPSFCINGDDRITFRLQPHDVVDLIFHRGAKARDNTDDLTVLDETGLVRWLSSDRGIVEFEDAADVQAKLPAVVALTDRWMTATSS